MKSIRNHGFWQLQQLNTLKSQKKPNSEYSSLHKNSPSKTLLMLLFMQFSDSNKYLNTLGLSVRDGKQQWLVVERTLATLPGGLNLHFSESHSPPAYSHSWRGNPVSTTELQLGTNVFVASNLRQRSWHTLLLKQLLVEWSEGRKKKFALIPVTKEHQLVSLPKI